MSVYDFKAYIRGILRRSGLARNVKKDHSVNLLSKYEIDILFDVGANNGQYGRQILSMGWKNPIISFEPLSSACKKLYSNSRPYPNWQFENLALGATDGEATINISSNSQSSSIRDILPLHVEAAQHSRCVGAEKIKVARLDSIIDRYCTPDDRCFLKMDVQGFEKNVLDGAMKSLDRIIGIQAEMAVTPLYEGETLFPDMVQFLNDHGYCLMSMNRVFVDQRTGQTLQLEGIFYQESEVRRLRDAA